MPDELGAQKLADRLHPACLNGRCTYSSYKSGRISISVEYYGELLNLFFSGPTYVGRGMRGSVNHGILFSSVGVYQPSYFDEDTFRRNAFAKHLARRLSDPTGLGPYGSIGASETGKVWA